MEITRRGLIGGAMAAGMFGGIPAQAAGKKKFRFVHLTDLHIEPELGAPDGVALAVKKILSLNPRPDFVLFGGDQVMDLLSVSRSRAETQFKLFQEATKPLEMPRHYVLGNHDLFGWGTGSSITAGDAGYGAAMFSEKVKLGSPYSKFTANGWTFLLLNSIQPSKSAPGWMSRIDDDQLTFMKSALESTGKTTPIVVVCHVPLFTIFPQYDSGTMVAPTNTLVVENAKEVRELMEPYQVKAVLQGHTHVVERCEYLGTQYITSGAICGEWWRGPRLGVHPEGFSVFDVNGDDLKWSYVPYGWKSRA